ncbi:coniferyl aldehyde dehydrogenase [Kordiimonas sp. SCSIO 12610]|uniref:coniferyl aldehyde dehydrogenase n=1 Tax=Kordiimonas sp. SCSIO 12610 TaxID=2829597 RepID=UPI00210CE7EF|nr:coniferyl aldehyde dehydrogenase [Kordiimonas sp. SCSIO 12610]UTW56761.1 coniferyl aldehyde dehydrogenase [Kordiimonas sp. SCSIO 12610]
MDNASFDAGSANIAEILASQRAAYLADGYVSAEVRIDRLRRVLGIILKHQDDFIRIISEDFGNRSAGTTLFADVVASVGAIRDAIKHVKKWMKPSRRSLAFPFGFLGARGQVTSQPKGVIGLITPWNFPMTMVFVPLAQMLAAGNRVMIKPSEHTPKTSAFFEKVFAEVFDKQEIAVINGGVEVSQVFSSQPFDHLMFTGAPSIGKLIMRSASENLVPVTLELGGKSPVLAGRSANMDMTASRVAMWKNANAGQICLAPDYINVHKDQESAFVEKYTNAVTSMFPTMLTNDDYTSIISARHRERLEGYLDDAREKGADVRIINPANEDFSGQNQSNKIPPALILNPTDDMKVMQEEIFGPILPVRTVESVDEAIGYVNGRERPLALYYFGDDSAEEAKIVNSTTSGSVCINDLVWQGGQENLPFGGVGNSGMGHYHGYDGFLEFSHQKSVLKHPKLDLNKLIGLIPPYGDGKLERNMKSRIGK